MQKIRLDLHLARTHPKSSRSEIKQLILAGKVLVDGTRCKPSYLLKGGERIEIRYGKPRIPQQAEPEEISLNILYEDETILVLNKPAGMVVHPAAGNWSGTLVNALLYHLDPSPTINTNTAMPLSRRRERGIDNSEPSPLGGRGKWTEGIQESGEGVRPGIVHRLDKGTSGVMVVAKTDPAHRELSRQFKQRVVKKRYLALVFGRFPAKEGTLSSAIGRDPQHRRKFSSKARHARQAVTHYKVLQEFGAYGHTPLLSLLEVYPETGRTHQIRVHLSEADHPIVGDTVYGAKSYLSSIKDGMIRASLDQLGRPLLHASKLTFNHPEIGKQVEFSADLPEDFGEVLKMIS